LKKMLYKWREETNSPVPTELNPKYNPKAKTSSKGSKKKKKKKKK